MNSKNCFVEQIPSKMMSLSNPKEGKETIVKKKKFLIKKSLLKHLWLPTHCFRDQRSR